MDKEIGNHNFSLTQITETVVVPQSYMCLENCLCRLSFFDFCTFDLESSMVFLQLGKHLSDAIFVSASPTGEVVRVGLKDTRYVKCFDRLHEFVHCFLQISRNNNGGRLCRLYRLRAL